MNRDRSPEVRPGRTPSSPRVVRPEPSQVIRRPTGPSRSADHTVPLQRVPPGPPSPAEPPRRPVAPKARRKHGKRGWFRIVTLCLLIGLLLVTAGILGEALWLETALRRAPVLADYPGRPETGRGTNWLLVGSDSRQGLTVEQQQDLATGGDIGSSRTDTIMLVHVPGFASNTPTTLVSIPRDSYVPIPGHGRDKINAAFAMGGAPLLAQTVEQATGLRLDHYTEIGFSGFAGLVDALGGVTVCPAAPINDPLAGIDVPAGCQTADGRTALGYVRTRDTPRADLDRMVNQRQFMSALLHRAASPAVWLNPWHWYSVPRAAADALTVNQGDHAWDVVRLGWALHVHTTTITVPIGELTDSGAGSVVVWNHDAARALFDALGSDKPVPADALNDQP